MNNFDRAVIKKTNALISRNAVDKDLDEEKLRKFKVIAKAIIRQESRGLKPNDNPTNG